MQLKGLQSIVETNEETFKRREEIVAEMDELLKHSGDTSIYSELHRMEGIMARARVNWQEQLLKSRDTSSQKNANEEVGQGTDRPYSFENRCVNEVNSLPEERDQCASKAHSKGNRTSVSSKSTTTKRVMLLELEAMKKQEEIDEQLAAKKREVEIRKKQEEMNMRILAEESEIAKLEEEKERAKRISEKEIEIARAGSSRANTSFRSVSPVPIRSDRFEKVPSWLDQIEVDDKLTKNENETSRIALASDPIQRQSGALPHTTKLFQPAAKMAQSTVANVGNSGNLFVPKVAPVTLKRGATQPVQFGTMLPPNQTTTNNKMTNDTVPPQVAPPVSLTAPPHSHFGHTRIENMSLPASLPKLKLAEFSGDPLEWPEWSGLFLSTVHAANIDASLKMNHLKMLVTGKAKEVIAGLGYTGDMYDIAWNTMVAHFGRPQVVVNAQLRRIYTFPPVKAYDSVALVKYSRIVSSCVQVLTQMNYVGDLQSEGVLSSATRKLPMNMKTKWLAHARQNANYYMGLEAFILWLQEVAAVQEDVLMTGNPNADKSKWASKDKPTNSTFSTFADDSADKKTGHDCPLKDGKYPLWKCEKFLKMTCQARYEKAKELKLCFCCFAGKHVVKDCTYKACRVKGCNKRHHRLLHREANGRPKDSGAEDPQQKAEANSAFCSLKSSGILPVIPVIIQIGKKQESTLALCDSGSSLSFIDKELANKLNAHGEEIDLSVAGIHGTNDVKCEQFTVGIRVKAMGDTHHMTVYTHPNIDAGTKIYNYQELKLAYPHLSVLSEETLKLKDVKMILGQNCYHIHRPVEYKNCTNGEPWAVKTKLGWTLCGPLPQQKAVQMTASCVTASEDDALAEQIKTWWDIESYASRCDVSGRSKEDEKALQMLEQTTKFDGERYEVGLLWKRKDPFLPNNYSSALSQMKSLEYRLEKKPELKKLYQDSIKVDVEKGFVRILKQEELEATKLERQWYVPHHPVENPNKPGKVRAVGNAASKFRGISFNDSLLTGPDLIQNLIGIIFRFREQKIAITADIEAMFLQVKVPPEDCKVLRFLWRDNPNEPIKVYEYGRHIFGANSSPTCANYALQQVAKDNAHEFPQITKLIMRNFYMDDFVKSVPSAEQAIEVYKLLRAMLAKGGFHLTEWISNCEQTMLSIDQADKSPSSSKTFEAEPTSPSILGLQWSVDADNLEVCRGMQKEIPVKITQRAVLSHVSAVFDPLGIVSLFTIRMRLLLKSIWKENGQSWDKELNEENRHAFEKWASEMIQVNQMVLKRTYFESGVNKVDLHIFSDASLEAMCMVAYLRKQDNGEVTFVLGKCRVASIRNMTVAKLEMQAALFGVRLRELISEEHNIEVDQIVHWTDSTTVLQWLHASNNKQPVFVANRVAEILENSTIDQWRHVEGEMNPADIGTGGMTVEALKESEWLTGPAWLTETEDAWPKAPERLQFSIREEPEPVMEAAVMEPAFERSQDTVLLI